MEKIDILQKIAMAHPSDHGQHAIASKDGSGCCKLCGSTNIEGRLINGVARNHLCDTFASSYNGQFIQIEQKRDYRRDSFAQFWNDVFNEAYPQFSALVVRTIDDDDDEDDGDDNKCLGDEGFCDTDQDYFSI